MSGAARRTADVLPFRDSAKPSGWNKDRWVWLDRIERDQRFERGQEFAAGADSSIALASVLMRAPKDCPDVPQYRTTIGALMAKRRKSESTIKRALRTLRAAGWIDFSSKGRGDRFTITFTFYRAEYAAQEPDQSAQKEVKNDPYSESENGSNLPGKWVKNDPPPTPPYRDTISFPSKPAPKRPADMRHVRTIVHPDSASEKAWNGYLADQGAPPLSDIGFRCCEGVVKGWGMPARWPPGADDAVGRKIAKKHIDLMIAARGPHARTIEEGR